MEDVRRKLGLLGRLELVRLIEHGVTGRAAAAALGVAPSTAQCWRASLRAAGDVECASLLCLRTRSSRARSCPWALSAEQAQAVLQARAETNRGRCG